ncbi:TetR/AcrR family transcriptional regulator [Homoserinibacter sp. GY 40078]|uniref:TetR/AcrR family transcriptional regulator n=1 Tax=Homoserinibacter sp. GY 40078 TaxID=2603275 RepID=UPI0011CC1117|nr:TetR/AcrR family transcriptional regulator [Homoserinibacter sp. GY 40078]TXK18469.1 TetR/AcrR family transcriptional regulator [Homoserinibacter sp. GY 40078]
MPAPEKTTLDQIVTAARDLVEQLGIDDLTMQAVATRVGVRAPSLYKRVRDRNELLALVVASTIDALASQLDATLDDPDPRTRIRTQADGLRRFAHERPVGYALLFGAHGAPRGEPAALARSVTPLLDAVRELTGDEHALDGARLVTAWANGFITMELAGSLRMGGDIDEAWNWGLTRIIATLEPH